MVRITSLYLGKLGNWNPPGLFIDKYQVICVFYYVFVIE